MSLEDEGYVVPVHLALANFGDVNYLDYGGQLLMPGAEEDDEPYLEIIKPPCDDEAEHGDWKPEWTIYQVEPEQLKLVEVERQVYLVCKECRSDCPPPVAECDQWFHKRLNEVATHIGTTMQSLRNALCSDDPKTRAAAYIDMASYLGWYEFDQYPRHLSRREVYARYAEKEEEEK